MNTEMSPRTRSVVSGLTAIAITTALMATLVESLNPALVLRGGESAAPERAAIADSHSPATLIRKV